MSGFIRLLLSILVPCVAVGLTGLLVTTIGRFLLAMGDLAATIAALIVTIAIMVGCGIASAVAPQPSADAAGSGH
ncbi:MAG: hypothetical protein EPO26_08900 [Chloroflexota bacterium]|nr:MAG: hypothetical protein EPO26_08900 [Chloroflexota bacterium]